MVALPVEGDRDGRSLYIAKVVDVHKTPDVHTMTIHWWHTDNKNPLKGRYVSEYEAPPTPPKVGRAVRLRV